MSVSKDRTAYAVACPRCERRNTFVLRQGQEKSGNCLWCGALIGVTWVDGEPVWELVEGGG